MPNPMYDVAVVGAGPAGIQAAIHAARKKTRVLVLGRAENSALYNAHIENYAFVDGVSQGSDLLAIGMKQIRRFGAEICPEDILKVEQEAEGTFKLTMESDATVRSHSLIFAIGVSKKKLAVPGEKELLGRGVSYCVDCDANFFRQATVAVVGNRSAAADGALTLLDYAAKVYLVARELNLYLELKKRLQASNVELITPDWVKEIQGTDSVTGLLLDSGAHIPVDGIFIELGSKGALELATSIGIVLDSEHFKYIATDQHMATNIPGIYAAGDITGPPYQMAKAVGQGCIAGMAAATYARKQKHKG